MEDRKIMESILKRLDIMINLQIDTLVGEDNSSVTLKVKKLYELGSSPTEIASIVGKQLNSITSIVSKINKVRRK